MVGLGLAGLLLLEWRGEMVGCLCSDSRDSLNNAGKELEGAAGEFFLGLDRDWGVLGLPLSKRFITNSSLKIISEPVRNSGFAVRVLFSFVWIVGFFLY